MKLAPGIKITDHVRLLSLLDEGGMGSVWVGEHLSLDIRVAVKFISHELAQRDPEVVHRFRREAKLAAKINSPHVVKTFDFGQMMDGTPYIVMELLRGNSLAEWLDLIGPLSPPETAELVKQTAGVLALAHELGVIHRDIKPGNLFLLDGGSDLFVKVLDFGIAKQIRIEVPKVVTAAGIMMGTPDYMSPERLLKVGHIDEHGDFWSLAVVAYQAMTGCLPFGGDTLPALAAAIINGRFTPPSVVADQLRPAVDEWFAKALAHEPADRFDSGSAMVHALELAVASKAPGRGPATLTSPVALDGATANAGRQAGIEVSSTSPVAQQQSDVVPDWVAPLAAPLDDEPPPPSSGTLALLTELPSDDDDVSRARWDVLFEGSVAGPVTTKLLMRGLETGSIPRTVQVRKSGSIDWHSIGDVPTLVSAADALQRGVPLGAYEIGTPTPTVQPSEVALPRPSRTRSSQPAARTAGRPLVLYVAAAAMVLVAVAAVLIMYQPRAPTAASGAAASTVRSRPGGAEPAAMQRCQAERARIVAGGRLGAHPTGWVVELWLGRRVAGLSSHPALSRLVAHERLAPGSGHVLDVVAPGAARARWLDSDPRSALGVDAVLLQLDGVYVSAFAAAAGRRNLERLAVRLMAASSADYGALFARCAHLESRDVGAWYGGRTLAGAAAAVLYAAGGFSEPTVIDRHAHREGGLLPRLNRQLTAADEARVNAAVASAGGRIDRAGEGEAALVSIAFGLDGAVRAVTLSRALAALLAGSDKR